MKSIFSAMLFMVSSLFMQIAYAEGGTCPNGYYPIGGRGFSGCAPIPDYDNGNNNNYAPPPPPPPKPWHSRHGALAIDGSRNVFGAAAGQSTEDLAQSLAISDCKSKGGGGGCKITKTYYNSCIVLAAGDKGGFSSTDITLAKAEASAMNGCQKSHTNCEIFYKACSLPVQY